MYNLLLEVSSFHFSIFPIIVGIIGVLITFAPVIIFIVLLANRKKVSKAGDEIAASIKNTLSPTRNQTKCEYCGSILEKDDEKCPNCGASKQR